jgi:uncharacterized repeat protein (TIGR02543 family)
VTYYAQWTAKSYKVTYDAAGGKNLSVTAKTVKYGSKYGTHATTSRTGYSFAGWHDQKSGGTKITKDTKVGTAKAHTLYAHWTAKNYTLKYNVNSGTPLAEKSKTVKYGSKYGELAVPERMGYTFKGWWTKASGGSQIKDTTKVKITKTTTVYAHWAAKSYKVTYDATGGKLTPTSKTVKYGSKYGVLATPTMSGYTFKGWWTDAEGGTQIKATTKVKITSEQTIYAHWKMK